MIRIVVNKFIPWGSYVAITIGPWVFVKDINKVTPTLIRHESIHWEQYKETLILLFIPLYVLFFVTELVLCLLISKRGRKEGKKNSLWKRAYRSNLFEREAYAHEEDAGYMGRRKHYAWLWPW